jgi:NAD(P)-dependent dehydrogenase (short-subunit alcohol dehydrogenase family)
MLLTHRVAVISSCAGGIGRRTARVFAEQGAIVVFLDPDEAAARAAAAELGSEHLGYACDFGRPESCQAAAKLTLAACGRVDVLVHNTYFIQSVRHVSNAFLPYMQARCQGSIACISSQQHSDVLATPARASLRQAELVGFARTMARELGPDNIRVNCVAPSFGLSSLARDQSGDPSADILDIAGALLFLASDLSAYLTGAVVDVDAGRLIH